MPAAMASVMTVMTVVPVVAMMTVVAVPKPENAVAGVPVIIVVAVVVVVPAVAIPVAAPPMAMAPVAIVDRIDLTISGRNILQNPAADRHSACRDCYHKQSRSEETKLRSSHHDISLHLTDPGYPLTI